MRVPSIKDPLFWILTLALVVRLVAALLVPDQGFPDAWTYRGAGAQFREFRILTYTDIMPLYPLLLTFVGSGWGQKAADIVLSVAMVWLVYAIAMQIYRDRAIALAAALFAALWPHFIFFAAVGLTETLFIVLVLAGLLSLYREHYWLGSALLVLSILTRPTNDPLAPFLILVFALFVHRRSVGFAASRLAVYALVYVALMTPWWLHNYAKYGEFVRLNVAGGMVLYTGNNPAEPERRRDQQARHATSPISPISKIASGAARPIPRRRSIISGPSRRISFTWPASNSAGSGVPGRM